ncbi:hypothetical protein [Marinigracilibium pacificum]|uniref:Uncharacterized protein n=1 Tax=Marinigracilibium pacificum TaxID=2729599 RepID=A0A848IWD7_9BACT|nr:hypothetical protein [Marinigracilibium pacificum]NMM47478.1 hypothetical protein [Marinigracilibium pacificum]
MQYYNVILKTGERGRLACEDRTNLILKYFNGDEDLFKSRVKAITWTDKSLLYSENIDTGSISKEELDQNSPMVGWMNTQ